MPRHLRLRTLPSLLLLAVLLACLPAPGAAFAGGSGGWPAVEAPGRGGAGHARGEAPLAVQLWSWLAGWCGWEGAAAPNGRQAAGGAAGSGQKEGATIDPDGQPHSNAAAGCQGEAGATIDPDGTCGTR